MRVRKKPVEVEAYQLDEANVRSVGEWSNSIVKYDDLTGEPSISIFTLEGTMVGHVGDWIIKGVNGEFYPCKDDIFRKTYDVLEDGSMKGQFDVVDIADNEDGSMSVHFEMTEDMLKLFAKVGLLKILIESAEKTIKEQGAE